MIRFAMNMTDDEMELLMREIDAQDKAYADAMLASEQEFCDCGDDCEDCESEQEYIEKAKWHRL